MATKNNPGPYDCWTKADPDEPYFMMLGRDRHGAALTRLWAEMREREGEDPKVVAEARQTADDMEAEARKRGKPVMTMDSVVMFATTLRQEKVEEREREQESQSDGPQPDAYQLRAGEIVVAGRGQPAKLVKIFGNDDPEPVRGQANIMFARSGPVTVPFESLRRAMPEEVEAYRLQGGRI